MKKISTVFAMLATVLVACNKTEESPVSNDMVQVSVIADKETTKVEFGDLAAGKRPVTWSASGEVVSLWEFADDEYSQASASTSFERNETDKSKAIFKAALTEKTASAYDYVSIYPASASRTGDKEGHPTCISYALSIDAADMQKPTATTPDNAWMVLTAVNTGFATQPENLNITFEHQTAYGKMTFKNFPLEAGETLQTVNVTGPAGKYFTGRRWLDYKTGDVTEYSAAAQKNTFTIDASELAANTTSFDIWFSVLPVDLAKDETLTIMAKTSRRTRVAAIKLPRALNFRKGEIADFTINWTNYSDLAIVCDFNSATAQEGWPTAESWSTGSGQSKTCTYKVSETESYDFILAEPSFATGGKIYWNTVNKYFFFGKYRYLGFPVISGYALKKVECTVAKQITSSAVAIMDHIFNNASAADPDSYAVAAQAWNVSAGTVRQYDVNATSDSQQYYLYCKNPSGGTCFNKLVLTYSKL